MRIIYFSMSKHIAISILSWDNVLPQDKHKLKINERNVCTSELLFSERPTNVASYS